MLRLDGEMVPIEGKPENTGEYVREMLWEIMPEKNRKEFDERYPQKGIVPKPCQPTSPSSPTVAT